MSLANVGVIHGRFQPIHIGHMEYLLAGKSRCKTLIIGIANPDPSLTSHTPLCPERSAPGANPFTYYERMLMIKESLVEAGVSRRKFEIVPFPVNRPELLSHYVPFDAPFYLTIYDEWGREKLKTFKLLGIKTEVMWERNMTDRITTGTVIRKLMAEGKKWQSLVPPAVGRIIRTLGLDRRVAEAVFLQGELLGS